MIEYPSILNSAKAPRKRMISFKKLDGSNIRVKWNSKKGFCLFGSRTQLIDETNPLLGNSINCFHKIENNLLDMFKEEKIFRNLKEIIVFGEYIGPNSFAGNHIDPIDKMEFIPFDIMCIKNNDRRFLLPQEFIKLTEKYNIPHPDVVYEGNLNESFIQSIREESIGDDLNEGVICKGTEYVGNYAGHVWMCKIKTQKYLEKLKSRYGEKWKEFWE